MTAVITVSGKIRALELLTNDMSHIGFGRPTWPDQLNPTQEDPNATEIGDIIGYARIHTKGWLVADAQGPIVVDGQGYSVSLTPTTIAYVEAKIPSNIAEGVLNGIGQIGVVGQNVVTSPVNAAYAPAPQIMNTGTLFRIQHIPVYFKPPNTTSNFIVIFPLLA